MNKMVDNSKQVLNLYEVNEFEEKQSKEKMKFLPYLLMIIGIAFILVGYFYNELHDLFIVKEKNIVNKETDSFIKLRCSYSKNDESLGVKYTYNNNYKFNEQKLKKSTKIITISALPNKDIADNNIKILNGKYSDSLLPFDNIDGINKSVSLKNNILLIKYTVDYEKVDITKIPKNDYIVINNKLDETYKSIKKENQLAGYLCE